MTNPNIILPKLGCLDFDTVFPESLCTKPNTKEPEVLESETVFLCLLVDSKCDDDAQLKVLRPYTWTGSIGKKPVQTLYGWVDSSGNIYDHFERSIHNDDLSVVAFKPFNL
jgi:hypothetical protein